MVSYHNAFNSDSLYHYQKQKIQWDHLQLQHLSIHIISTTLNCLKDLLNDSIDDNNVDDDNNNDVSYLFNFFSLQYQNATL